MKSSYKPQIEPKTPKYPCLMELKDHPGTIVMMTAPSVGVVVSVSNPYNTFGENYSQWIMDSFKPYYGTVTLSSEK